MKKLLFSLLLITLVAACNKPAAEEGTCKKGFMVWGGDPAADRLGWYFTETLTNSTRVYKFDNLPALYQQNGLPVTVCFVETGKTYNCFCTAPLPLYHITRIQK